MKKQIKIFLLLLVASFTGLALQAQTTLFGNVKSKTGDETLSAVSVTVKGTTNSAQTDSNGKYAIRNAGENAILVFSFIGLTTQEINIAGQSVINVTLKDEQKELKEVVIIGYARQIKKDVIGNISKIRAPELTVNPGISFDALVLKILEMTLLNNAEAQC